MRVWGTLMINRIFRPVVTIHDEREAARHARGCIAIIDDDDAIREAVKTLLDLEGYATATYASASQYIEFMERNEPGFPGPRCVLLDVKMPEQTGLELQHKLNALNDKTPLVFMSGGSGAQEAVQALKNGAIDFLIKPFEEEMLLAVVSEALQKSLNQQAHLKEDKDASGRLSSLSERESQIARMVSAGMLNRDIAERLGIAVRTVKLHRMHMMRKLGVSNVIELARIIDRVAD
jgi:two-component system, LuxR family, response regulator FixJ